MTRTNYWNQNKVKGGVKIFAQSYMEDKSQIGVILLSGCSNVPSCSTASCSTTPSCSTASCSTTPSCSTI